MKRNNLIIALVMAFIAFGTSSCTKEQQMLTILHGDWELAQVLNNDGTVPTPVPGFTQSNTYTFFDCNLKNQNSCTYAVQTTSTTTIGATTTTNYSGRTGLYSVEEKSLLVLDGNLYPIDNVSKKTLVIHPASEPKATWTFNKK